MAWEQDVIQRVLLATIKEQRQARRWKVFFRLIFICLIGWAIYAVNGIHAITKPHDGSQVAVVDFKGIISSDSKNYSTLIEGINNALEDSKTVAVLIRANSPGGSPVYSDMVNNEITRLRKKYPKIPIDFVVEEVCASGCYYAGVAADKIYAAPASIVGSIGVIYTGFGATAAIKKLGLDSRLLISGRNKAMGYPFVPESQEQTLMQQQMLDEIHEQFINAVKIGRGNKLARDPDLFSGRYWTGTDALKLGLIDGYGTVASIAREQFKSENIVDFTPDNDPLDKISRKFGMGIVNSANEAILSSGISGSIN